MPARARQTVTSFPSRPVAESAANPRARLAAAPRDAAIPAYASTADLVREARPELPVLCFSERLLEAQVAAFQDGFPGLLTYAVKANCDDQVMSRLARWGVHAFDVASLPEMEMVKRHVPGAQLFYNNPIKSRGEIKAAHDEMGVRHFTIDDQAELDKIIAVLGTPGDVTLAVRFMIPKTTALFDFYTKFGATRTDAIAIATRAREAGFKVTLSFHPGSQCTDPAAYANHIRVAADIARKAGLDLADLNVGGGFPTNYPGSHAPDLSAFFTAIAAAKAKAFKKGGPRLVCEPGRAIVAPAMSLLTQVRHKRKNGILFLNDGIYGALMETSLVPIDFPARAFAPDGSARQGKVVATKIFGPTCDSVDKLPRPIPLPDSIQEGDYVEFGAAGAYSLSTLTAFNGFGRLERAAVDQILEPQ